MREDIRTIVAYYDSDPENLISILQEIQEQNGYISQEAVKILAEELNHPESRIYGVATFYTQFKFQKPGEHMIRVCLGTACHVKGAEGLLEVLEHELGISAGGTTPDGKLSLESVVCMGCCAVGPVMVVDEEIYGKMTPEKIRAVVSRYRSSKPPAPKTSSPGGEDA